MKFSRFLYIALLSSTIFVSTGQADDSLKGVEFYFGPNFSDVSMDSSTSTSSTIGYVLGGSYDYGFGPDLSFRPGVQIAQRGFGFDIGMTEVDLKMTYLEFPLLFEARFRGAPVVPFFTGGPVLGVKLSTGCSVNGGDCAGTYDSHNVKSTHLGLELGGGVLFPLESGASISAALRYHLGLTRVASGLADPRHRGLVLEGGYRF